MPAIIPRMFRGSINHSFKDILISKGSIERTSQFGLHV